MAFGLIGMVMLVSCEQLPTDVQDDEYVTIPFSILHASIIQSDMPLDTKTGDETEYTYVVHVYEESLNVGFLDYARGVFSSPNFSIRAKVGRRYNFEVALFKDFFSSGECLTAYSNRDTTYFSANNKFVYDDLRFSPLQGSSTYSYLRAQDKTRHKYFMGDAFYGSLDNYTATTGGVIEINLNRVSAYLDVVVNGLVEGTITSDLDLGFSIAYPNTTYSSWITDNQFRTRPNSFNNQAIGFTYTAPDGTQTELAGATVEFIRNHKKRIVLNLSYQSPATEQSNSFSLNISDTTLDESDEDIVVDNII